MDLIVRVMVLNATFNNISVNISWQSSQFYWWRKPDLPQVTNKLVSFVIIILSLIYNKVSIMNVLV
jgi:hypothetical protein